MTVTCPWCDYEGQVESVEGHISGMADQAHRGKVGYDLQSRLPQLDDRDGDMKKGPPVWVLVAAAVVLFLVIAVRSEGEVVTEDLDRDEQSEDGGQVGMVEA